MSYLGVMVFMVVSFIKKIYIEVSEKKNQDVC